jgi:hypothetical protein
MCIWRTTGKHRRCLLWRVSRKVGLLRSDKVPQALLFDITLRVEQLKRVEDLMPKDPWVVQTLRIHRLDITSLPKAGNSSSAWLNSINF